MLRQPALKTLHVVPLCMAAEGDCKISMIASADVLSVVLSVEKVHSTTDSTTALAVMLNLQSPIAAMQRGSCLLCCRRQGNECTSDVSLFSVKVGIDLPPVLYMLVQYPHDLTFSAHVCRHYLPANMSCGCKRQLH